MKSLYAVVILLSLLAATMRAQADIGFHQSLVGDAGGRRMEMAVWYPAAGGGKTRLVGDNAAFIGLTVAEDAAPLAGPHPLVVISHGYGGNWKNQLWLAGVLVGQGYIVAAPNHPGTTTDNRDPALAARLWQRPGDISRAIDRVSAQPQRYGAVATGRIAVVGHSLGGWTAMEIAGARFDPELFARDCAARQRLASCQAYWQMNAGGTPALQMQLARDWRDRRVGAVITLDTGLARGFTGASLSGLRVPVLIIAAGTPSETLPASLESHYLAGLLPPEVITYHEIGDATHFSFMAICKPGAAALIDQDSPGDGIICQDGDTRRTRAQIQQQAAAFITQFLARSLPGR
ncbi:alpha/beta hydrolase family protein [Acerihabitans arboris]|uniref:Dienelactone hydrolase n=1 Tax=Acerihabitans arboris TaxID=2691583 RepID=A0A845SGP6_9GAMM|nr:dienelactone hydrolase family protein [Acerihabitans arboris]NDL61801.1 dienelactone hydrolase [Acerihabitans arboris]